MGDFGKHPARDPESFGVAGLLEADCHVVYENLFSTQQIGRVSDLIVARLRGVAVEELPLRATLLFGAFQAFDGQASPMPITIECGSDSEKVAVSFAFVASDGVDLDLEAVASRIRAGAPSGVFEILASHLLPHCHRLILRGQASTRRVEVVALAGIPSKMDAESLASERIVQVVWVASEADSNPAALARRYTELGDLDYTELLRESSQRGGGGRSPTGEFLVRAFDEGSRVERTVVSGAGEKTGESAIIVSGASPRESEVVRVVSGKSAAADTGYGQGASGIHFEKIQELMEKIRVLEEERDSARLKRALSSSESGRAGAEAVPAEAPARSSRGDGREGAGDNRITRLFRKVWPFKQRPEGAIASNDDGPGPSEAAVVPPATRSEPMAAGLTDGELDSVAQGFLKDVESGSFAKMVKRVSSEAAAVKGETQSSKTQKFIENMMAELAAERSRLSEMAKSLSATLQRKELELRQRELQAREKERALQTEVRAKDRAVRHKEYELGRLKEALAQANVNLERLKAQVAVSTPAKARSANAAEITALQIKLDRAQKQLDDQKRAYQALAGRTSESQRTRDSSAANVGELKTRLDASVKMVALGKKQNEHLTTQIEAMRREEARLKMELNKAASELTRLKSGKARGQSSGGSTPSGSKDDSAA